MPSISTLAVEGCGPSDLRHLRRIGPDSLQAMASTGETQHDLGRTGAARVQSWLEGTTRTNNLFTNQSPLFGSLLQFGWPEATQKFSFDLGGEFIGGDIHGQGFAAEVKNYTSLNNLSGEYLDFLAKCYVAVGTEPSRFTHFLWISTVPLTPSNWFEHTKPENVVKALKLERNMGRALGATNEDEAHAKIDHARTVDVARRVWLVTMNGHEHELIPTLEDLGELTKHRILAGGRP